jgi:predicted RNA-binding Zn ribbon-like protein
MKKVARKTGQAKAAKRDAVFSNFFTIGNRLSIDFGNTVAARDGSGEALRLWPDVVDFLVAAGQLDPKQRDSIKALAETDREGAARAFRLALELRNAVRRIVELLAERREVAPEWVGPINRVLRLTESHDELVRSGAGWQLRLVPREQRLEWLLAAVARSAAELAEEGPRAPVRKCAGTKCVLYFYDSSRTRRRRWCSMAVCGNRNKVAAFAQRHRASG